VYTPSGDSNVYEFTWTGATWQRVSIGNAGVGGVKVQSIPAKAKRDDLVRIYGASADGGVDEYTWTGSAWQTVRLGQATAYMYGLAAGDGLNKGTTQIYGSSYDGNAYLFEWMPATVTVPNVLTLTQSAATTALANASLTLGTVSTTSNSIVPAGLVFSQDPVPGTEVAPGTAVSLIVSSGPGIFVPDVVTLTQAAAAAALTSAGLMAGTVSTAFHATLPAGSVISQTPGAGTQVPAGSAVALVVSSGPGILVPNVVNLAQAGATAALTSVGLAVGTVSNASSTTVPMGSVISQIPGAGTLAASGSSVDLVVSSGVTVPNVVGQPQSAVAGLLAPFGLVVGTVNPQPSPTVPIGVVISQLPAANTQVSGGSAVTLVVSSGVSVPNVVGQLQTAVAGLLGPLGLVVGTVTPQSSTTVPIGVVISQLPAANTQVSRGSAVNLVVSSGPPPTGPTVDKVVFSDGAGSRTLSLSTSGPNEVLIAFGASDGPSTGAQALTVSGGGLTWTLVRRSNTRAGASEIWKATAAAQLSNVTVTSTQSASGYHQSLTVVAFAGATGTGASAVANGATGAPSVTLITTKAGSLVYGVGNDWDRAVARTLGPSQTTVHIWVDTAIGDTYWVQAWTGTVANSGVNIQLNDTAPTNDRWNFASVEIVG
jgi:beta-lactam-binding protein with PASTA domain